MRKEANRARARYGVRPLSCASGRRLEARCAATHKKETLRRITETETTHSEKVELDAECKGKRKGADNDECLVRSSHIELVPKTRLEGLADALATRVSTRLSGAYLAASAYTSSLLHIASGYR